MKKRHLKTVNKIVLVLVHQDSSLFAFLVLQNKMEPIWRCQSNEKIDQIAKMATIFSESRQIFSPFYQGWDLEKFQYPICPNLKDLFSVSFRRIASPNSSPAFYSYFYSALSINVGAAPKIELQNGFFFPGSGPKDSFKLDWTPSYF